MNIRSRLLAAAIAAACAGPALAQDGVGRFDISGYEIAGNTLLDPAAIQRLLAPYTGRARDFGDVQMALEALEAEYRKRGYNVVQVALPEQELNNGVVRLSVVETRIGRVRVEGNSRFDEANIRASVPGLQEGRSPNLADVSSSLRLANENPSKKTTLQLQSGAREDEVDAVLKVADDKPWRVGASVDNAGNRTTGEAQLTVQYQHANLGGRDHVMSLQYTTSIENPSDVSIYGVGYHIPLYGIGDSLDLFASYSDVDTGWFAVGSGVGAPFVQSVGKGTVAGLRYNHTFNRIGDYEARVSLGLDHKSFESAPQLQGVGALPGSDLTLHPLSLSYSGGWTAEAREISFGVTALRNIPGGGKGGRSDLRADRADADENYSIVRYSLALAQGLSADWQARVAVSGQYTKDPLVSAERFGAGGAATVRGFAERDLTDDVGQLFNAEVYTPDFCSGMPGVATQCRALAFYDTARVRRISPLPGERRSESIGSVGLGLRVGVGKVVSMQVDYGHVIDGGSSKSRGADRVHVKLGISY